MKIIFIGTIIPDDYIHHYPETSIAANNFQTGLLQGLLNDQEINCSILSVPPRRAWPGNGSVFYQAKKLLKWQNTSICLVPFLNIKFWKELSIRIHSYFAIQSALKKVKSDERAIVISYNGDGRISHAIRKLKKRKGFKYICMVVDPPEYKGTTKRSGRFWGHIYSQNRKAYMKAVSSADALVVLNKAFITINSLNKPYLVIDGGVSLSIINKIKEEDPLIKFDNTCFNIVFTGTIHEHSGILRLIDMFKKFNDNKTFLHIFGDGVLREQVEENIKNDLRIVYHGPVDFKKAISAQHEADLIVCPNPINHPINRVAFPSKLIEYLGSGTPILATSLDSIGKEYEDCVIFYNDTEEDFLLKLSQIKNMTENERNEISGKAYRLAENEKEWGKQALKLCAFIKECCE